MRRVVVTGLGLVTPVGTDVESSWSALLAGTPGAAPITKFDPQQLSVRFACEVKGFDALRYMQRALQALDARGVVREDEDAGRIRYRLEDPFLATWIAEAQRV